MGSPDIASLKDGLLDVGHEAMAIAFTSAPKLYDRRICASLPKGPGPTMCFVKTLFHESASFRFTDDHGKFSLIITGGAEPSRGVVALGVRRRGRRPRA